MVHYHDSYFYESVQAFDIDARLTYKTSSFSKLQMVLNVFRWGRIRWSAFLTKNYKYTLLHLEVILSQDGADLEKFACVYLVLNKSFKLLSRVFTYARGFNCHSSQEVISVFR
jgi:hypothetical protein